MISLCRKKNYYVLCLMSYYGVTINYIVEQLQTIKGSNCKIEFLTEQLSLV